MKKIYKILKYYFNFILFIYFMFKEETLSEKLIKKGFWLYFFSFLIAPLWYFIRLIISNDLTVQEVWVIYSIIWLISLLVAYNDLWFSESLKYFLPKFWIQKQYDKFQTVLFLTLIFQILTSIIIWLWLFFGAWWLADNYFHSIYAEQILKILALFFFIFNLFLFVDNILVVFQDIFWSRLFEFIRMFSIFLLSLIFSLVDIWSLFNYAMARFIWTFLAFILALIYFLKKYYKKIFIWKIKFDKDLLKQFIWYALLVFITIQWAIILWQIDLQFAIYFLGPQDAWYYTNFLSLFSIYWLLITPLLSFLFPVVSELNARNDNWKLNLLWSFFYKYFGILWIWFALAYWILGPVFAVILYWEKFINSWIFVSFIWFAVFFVILNGINLNILAGIWKIKQRAIIIWIVAILNIILNFVLLQLFGIWGILIATAIWWFLMWILTYIVLKKYIKFNVDYYSWVKNFIFAFVLFALVKYFFDKIFILKEWYRLYDLKNLLLLFVISGILIILVNFKDFIKLKNEIKKVIFVKR